jgi:hypothetical protein
MPFVIYSAVKIYNATSGPVRFESENTFFCFEKTLYLTTSPAL